MKVQEKHGVTFCLCVNLIFIVKREEMNELCLFFFCVQIGLRSSPFITFSICCNLERDRNKKNNDGGIHLMIGPTTYFFVSISLQIATNGKNYKWRGSLLVQISSAYVRC
jgi:hypothetical protein